jgi:hypothetical protein
MAITVNNFQSVSGINLTTITLSSYAVSAGTAGERVLVVATETEEPGAGASVSSVEFGGVSLTQAVTVNETQNTLDLWYLNDAQIGAGAQTEDVVVTFDVEANSISIAAFWLDGTSQSGPTQTVTNSSPDSGTTSISATINGVAADAIVLNAAGTGDTRTMTPDGAQTKAGEQIATSSVLAVAYEIPGAGNHTQGWTYVSSRRPHIALAEWAEASGGGGFQAAWAKNSNTLIQGGAL